MSDGESIAGREREVTFHTPGALTREERFDRANVLIGRSGLVASDMDELRGHVGALCRTITQQAQELALTRGAMASQDERERKAGEQCGVPYAESGCDWPWSVAEVVQSLRQQLAASQARCREMEEQVEKKQALLLRSCRDNIEDYKVECKPTCDDYVHADDCPSAHPGLVYDELRQQLAQLQATLAEANLRRSETLAWCEQLQVKRDTLQATLAARETVIGQQEATIRGYRHSVKIIGQQHDDRKAERDAAVQEAGRLREALEYYAQTAIGARAIAALNTQQASGSSGGAADHYGGQK